MRTLLSIACVLCAFMGLGQTAARDTAYPFKPNEPIDTTGMGQYGMRLYNPRMTRYLPTPAPADTALITRPYYFNDKKKQQKKIGNGIMAVDF